MALSIPVFQNKLEGKDLGGYSYYDALSKGYNDYQSSKKMSEDLLAQKLLNKLNSPKAEHAEERESLERELMKANAGKASTSAELARNNINFLKDINERLSGNKTSGSYKDNLPNALASHDNYVNTSNPGVSPEGPGIAPSTSARDTFPGRFRTPFNNQNTNIQPQGQSILPKSTQPSYQENLSQNLSEPKNNVTNELPENVSLSELARLAKLQGMSDRFPVKEVNGKLLAITPWGNKQVGQGLDAKQKAFEAGLGASSAKIYESAYNAGNSLEQQNSALDQMIDQVKNNPEARNVVGPFNQWATKYLGTPDQQKLLGQISTGSGDIMLAIAHDVKGAWSGKDMAMANSIKANPNDPYGVFLGKLETHRALNELTKQRTDMIANLVYRRMAPHEAAKIAREKISFDPIKAKIDGLLKTAEQYNLYMSHKTTKFSDESEFKSFVNMLTPIQKIEYVSKMRGK